MRFTFFLSLLLLLSNTLALPQSTNHNQKLADLISAKRWFDVENYYQDKKDSIDNEFVKLWYIAETGNAFNRSGDAINAYEQLLDKNPINMNFLALLQLFGQPVLQLCADVQAYSRGESICLKLMGMVEKDTTVDQNSRLAVIQDLTKALDSFKSFPGQYPKLQVFKRETRKNATVHLLTDKSEGIYFNANWNGVPLRTHFDTGAGAGGYIWNRKIADKIGAKLNTSDTILFNNAIPCLAGVVDSLQIGSYYLYSVPVIVSIENIDSADRSQVLCDSILNSNFDIVLGTPIIRHLGAIRFDFRKKTMSFPVIEKNTYRRNLYIKNSVLYINLNVCDDDFLAFFDTGWRVSSLFIGSEFYNKHKDKLPTDTVPSPVTTAIGGCNKATIASRIEYECPRIDLKIGDWRTTLDNKCFLSKDKENDPRIGSLETGSGVFGCSIFNKCEKVLFDFNNMVFRVDK